MNSNIKKIHIFLLCFIMLFPTWVYSQDFSPIIQIVNVTKGHQRQYSGVIYQESQTHYFALSCAHGTLDLDAQYISLQSNIVNNDGGPLAYVSMRSQISKSDIDRDIAVISFRKVPEINIIPLKVSTHELPLGTNCNGFGYVSDTNLITNPLTVNTYDKFKSNKGAQILECIGRPISGMSGGPLIYENEIYGIQSAGNTTVLYCPTKEIHAFLSE